jgi:mediator of RNA polymerase II transcription subunit 12
MTSLIFHHSMASEEAYFIAEMARGVDGPVAIKVSGFIVGFDVH